VLLPAAFLPFFKVRSLHRYLTSRSLARRLQHQQHSACVGSWPVMLSSWCCPADSWHVILPCLPSIKRFPPTLHSFPSTSHNVCRHGLLHVGCSPHWRAQPWCWRGGLGAPDNTGGNSNSSYHKRSREDSSKVCEFLPCLLQTASAPAFLRS
jgi:hypothetical protein